jgi:hypothetical protein
MTANIKLNILLISLFFFISCSSDSSKNTPDKGLPENNDQSETEIEEDQDHSDIEISDDEVDEEENNNFADGPYGYSFGDTAEDFSLPLEKGDWIFSEKRSEDENYIFVFYRPTNSESRLIWQSSLIKLLDNSPENTHYFFLIEGTSEIFEQRTQELKENIKNSMEISGRLKILDNIHLAKKPAGEIDSWLSDWLKRYDDFFLGIDRFQKLRKGGSFHSWQSSSLDPKFDFLYKEAELYNFEHQLSAFLDKNNDKSTYIDGIDGIPFDEEGWVKDIYFESEFPQFSSNGKLYIYLKQICRSQQECEWDRLQHLYLCEKNNPEKCDIEIGRWITTYGRSGKWLTDISPLLPLFKNPEKYKFRFTVAGDNYENFLQFIFVKDSESVLPSYIFPLYNGTTQFDENYNSNFDEIELELPDKINKAVISAYITGHGNGSEAENCAEFCKFESVFYVNDTPFSTKFNNAGTSLGCYNLVSEGVVPNQYGSWPFGRAGWCPGQDVKLINIDITEIVIPGKTNTFNFKSLLHGKDYVPVVTDSSGYRAEIPLSSSIVIW